MIRIIMVLAITIVMISGCTSAGFHDLEVYSSPPPISSEPLIRLGKPTGALPLFQFRFVKEGVHEGMPRANEIQMIKTKGASMGASKLILDCPGPGQMGFGMCMVYGYEK